MLISAYGIVACIISSIIGIYVYKVNEVKKINTALMLQLVLSTLLSIIGIYFAASVVKEKFIYEGVDIKRSNLIIITIIGLINGFLIGMITNYYTSYDYSPV